MTETFPVINMTNWVLFTDNNKAYLSGTVEEHPKLGKNVYVWHTSHIDKVLDTSNNIITVRTRNSIYVCPIKYMSDRFMIHDYACIQNKFPELARIIRVVNSIIDGTIIPEEKTKLFNLLKQGRDEIKQIEEKIHTELIQNVQDKENTVYIEISNISTGNPLAYHIGDKLGVIKPDLHVGSFQDSVLYMEDGVVDFRYFPEGTGMTIYNWSNNIKHVIIKNLKTCEIRVDRQYILPGETVEIDRNNYNCGLFSPDCVDGGSIFKDLIEDGSKEEL